MKDTSKNKTKVIFRKYKYGGDIVAIFPEIAYSYDIYDCLCYENIGQHGSCNPSYLISKTKPATPDEYKGLYNELVNDMEYDLKVYKKLHPNFIKVRIAQIKEWK